VKNLFEKTREDIQLALIYAEELLNIDKLELDENTLANVPKETGIYIFYSKNTNEEKDKAYIGRAIGKNGLYQRIIRQHLNPKYSKSVFKLAVAKKHSIHSMERATGFIKNKYTFAYRPINEKGKSPENGSFIKLIETLLLYEFETEYNKKETVF